MRIGILGGGQLARMLALAGRPLGHRFYVTTVVADPQCPAAPVVDAVLGPYTDPAAVDALAEHSDVVTLESENVPVEVVERLVARGVPVRPGAAALTTSSDRLVEKTTFNQLGIPTVEFRAVSDASELERAVEALGLPAILKTRRNGYDGKGQWMLRTPADVEAAKAEFPAELILEGFASFERELSVIAVRNLAGELEVYPLAENRHKNGILQVSTAPTCVSPKLQQLATEHVRALAEHLDYVGVLALELFDMGERLLGNEMAPRVHNSGHWTIEGAHTSQFENHVRAIAGQPLGLSTARGDSAMVNLIGELPTQDVLAIEGAHLHLYDKAPRPGRKLGHVTLIGGGPEQLLARVESLLAATLPPASSAS